MVFNPIDMVWIVVCSGLIFIMQAGFLCLESGLTRTKNSINVAMKNITDMALAIVIFWAVGFAFMFGESYRGLIGSSTYFFLDTTQNPPSIVLIFLFQAMFCGTAITIISGAIAERVVFSGYLVITVIMALFIYPIVGHWVWGGLTNGSVGWLADLGFVDFAGATVVHSVGGWAALAMLIVIGPRSHRFNEKGEPNKVQPSNLPLAMLGVLILWFGWIGFNGGSALEFNDNVPIIIVNTIMSACAGLSTGMIVERYMNGYYSPSSAINGVLAGLVAITACCNIVSTQSALMIGAIGACFAIVADRILLRYQIDDAVGATPVHLAGGIWGTLAVAIFGEFPADVTVIGQLSVQLIGMVVCGAWAFVVAYVAVRIVNYFVPIRVCIETEYRGLNVSEHKASSELIDLVSTMENQSRTGDMSLRAPIEPFTETGQIATFYNKALDTLEQTSLKLDATMKRYQIISNFSPVGIFNINANYECIFVNHMWCELFEICHDEAIGRNWAKLSASNGMSLLLRQWAMELASGKQLEHEAQFKKSNGETCLVNVLVVPERDENGELLGYIGTVNDITERVGLESRLQSAEKLESIGQMAAGIAHEINSPLQFIGSNTHFIAGSFRDLLSLQSLYTKLLSSVRSGEDSTELISEIEALYDDYDIEYLTGELPTAIEQTVVGIDRVSKIIRSMKEFSHPSKNDVAVVDLNRSIENTIVLSRNEWKYYATIKRNFQHPQIHAECVESKINQVLLILIVNAAQALDGGKQEQVDDQAMGTIEIATSDLGSEVEISVSDDGPGIPEGIRSKVFDPFFTTKEVGKGSGQGLAIAYKIITSHNGSICVSSEEGEGCRFVIRLPKEQSFGQAES